MRDKTQKLLEQAYQSILIKENPQLTGAQPPYTEQELNDFLTKYPNQEAIKQFATEVGLDSETNTQQKLGAPEGPEKTKAIKDLALIAAALERDQSNPTSTPTTPTATTIGQKPGLNPMFKQPGLPR